MASLLFRCKGCGLLVDSVDQFRIDVACRELHKLMGEAELRDLPLLVYANKQDLDGALSRQEITEKLQMNDMMHTTWHVQLACARDGEGLYEGLDWLSSAVQQRMPQETLAQGIMKAWRARAENAATLKPVTRPGVKLNQAAPIT